MGAGGLLCASLEVVKRGREHSNLNIGCEINLDKVPTKYSMEACHILTSESQERMLIVCDPIDFQLIGQTFQKWDLEYAVIGTTNLSGNYTVKLGKEQLISFRGQLIFISESFHLKDLSCSLLHKSLAL